MKESLEDVASSVAVGVSAPSRLHFGLLRFAAAEGLSYGGLGLMIDQPRLEVRISPANHWTATGPHAGRALRFAKKTAQTLSAGAPPSFAIEVLSAPDEHTGLGSGTQLALAVAAALYRASDLPLPCRETLAAAVGRGRRSAVGTHGFFDGGLIFEEGYARGESLGKLAHRTPVSPRWRFLLIRPRCESGMSGPAEEDVFQRLQPPPQEATDRLAYLATEQIIPAAEREQFGSFVQSLYEYGVLAGQCFASAQGGPFASPTIEACVKRLRSMGVYGVGQTSWGPTIFAAAENAIEAEVLCAACHADPFWQDAEFTIASADNAGATIDVGWL